MKVLFAISLLALSACPSDESGFIQGTATLPNCSDAPTHSLDGTRWYDNGTIVIQGPGCPEATIGDALTVCALDWVFSQTGNDVEITVDNEYRIKGRLCADKLHLQGGWWLPVADEADNCTYEEDSAEEVAIQSEGNVLIVGAEEIIGDLSVKGRCQGRYDVTFRRK